MAHPSACTAIVANRTEMKRSPHLVPNANDTGMDVAGQKGRAPSGDVRLVD